MTRFSPGAAFRSAIAGLAGACLLAGCQSVEANPTSPAGSDWVATWTSSPSLPIPGNAAPRGMTAPKLEGTLRYVMRVSAGGDRMRVVIDGGPSVSRLSIGAATIALADAEGASISSVLPLTFSGAKDYLLLAAGGQLWSDPVDLSVPDGGVVAVNLYLREPVEVPQADPQLFVHVAPGADQTHAAELTGATKRVARPLVSAVHAENADVDRVVVAFGDSITDGMGSKDPLMRGWPDFLAARMRAAGLDHVAIVNQGIGGNRLLQDSVGENALKRFDRDVLAVPGVTDVIILEAINDIGVSGLVMPGQTEPYRPLTADDIIGAYKQLIARAHAHGIRAIGATLTPDLNSPFPGYATEEKDTIRRAVNDWIRHSGAFDAVIDFDAVIRDPQRPNYMADIYNSGDSIHPSDAGYRAMADSIDLDLFR